MANEGKKEAKYEGQFKKLGRKGRLAEAVYNDCRSHEPYDNTYGAVAERLFKAGVTKGELPNVSGVRFVMELLVAMNKLERKPVGNSALFKAL